MERNIGIWDWDDIAAFDGGRRLQTTLPTFFELIDKDGDQLISEEEWLDMYFNYATPYELAREESEDE